MMLMMLMMVMMLMMMFQVYSSSKDRRTCRLCSWSTLTDPGLGYIDHQGLVTLSLSLDMETHVRVHVLTENSIRENFTGELFTEKTTLTTMSVAKNIRFGLKILLTFRLKNVGSLRQFFCDLEEECETIRAQPLETSHIAPTSTWSLGQAGAWRPRRLTNDAYRTLFQLKEYHLLQDLYVFVETELLRQVHDQNDPGTEIKRRKSDILCFVVLKSNSAKEEEQIAKFLGPVTVPVNSNAKAVVEKSKNLVDEKILKDTKVSYEFSGLDCCFDENNIPGDMIVESGFVLIVRVEKVERRGNTYFN